MIDLENKDMEEIEGLVSLEETSVEISRELLEKMYSDLIELDALLYEYMEDPRLRS